MHLIYSVLVSFGYMFNNSWTESRECPLPIGPESFVFQLVIPKYEDYNTQNCNVASCFV